MIDAYLAISGTAVFASFFAMLKFKMYQFQSYKHRLGIKKCVSATDDKFFLLDRGHLSEINKEQLLSRL